MVLVQDQTHVHLPKSWTSKSWTGLDQNTKKFLFMLEYTPLLLCSRCLSLSAKERRAIAFLLRRCAMHKVAVMGKWRKFGAILMGLFCNKIYLKAGGRASCEVPRIRVAILATIYFRTHTHIKKLPQINNNMYDWKNELYKHKLVVLRKKNCLYKIFSWKCAIRI